MGIAEEWGLWTANLAVFHEPSEADDLYPTPSLYILQ